MKAEIIAVGAAEDLIDFRLERHVHGIFCLFDDRIEDHEPPAVFQHPQHFVHDARRIAEVVQAERDESAVEATGLKRKSVGRSGALIICGDWIFVLMADVEHRQRLIDADDAPAVQPLRHRSGHAAGAGGHVEHSFVAFEREHLSQLLRQIAADLGDPPVKFRGVRWVVEMSLVLMAVTVIMWMLVIVVTSVVVAMLVTMWMFRGVILAVTVLMFVVVFVTVLSFVFFVVIVRVVVIVGMLVTMIMFVVVMMSASVIVFSFFCHFPIPFSLLLPSAHFSRRLIRLRRSLLPFLLTPHSSLLTPDTSLLTSSSPSLP